MGTDRATLAFCAALISACGGNTVPEAVEQPLDPKMVHYGKTYAEWAGAWVQWVYEWPVTAECLDPIADPTGELCNLYQDGSSPVFFLTGNWGTVSRRPKCKPPPGKALLIPIVQTFQDNGGVLAANLKTDAQLKQSSEALAESSSGSFSLDGRALEPLAPYLMRAAPYEYTAPPEPSLYTCQGTHDVVGTFRGYTSGYFVLFAPLRPGPHTIAFTGTGMEPGAAPFHLDVRYDPITIP